MKCILVFDTLNDLIFIKFNSIFCNHVKKMAKQQGLTSKENFNEDERWLNPDLVIQLFSPLITSQRIMTGHFSNGYSNIQCGDETNIVFENYMGHLFIYIANGETRWLKKVLAVCISLIKHICGPDVSLLKTCSKRNNTLKRMLDVWYKQVEDNVEQSIIVEAVEQLRMNSQVAMVTIKALQEATEKMKSFTEFTQVHALVLVNHKFLSLYSSRNASELTASDILLLSLLGAVAHEISDDFSLNVFADSSNESLNDESLANVTPISYNPSSSTSVDENERTSEFSEGPDSRSFTLLLSKWKPHAVHVSYIARDIPLFLMHEVGNENLNVALFEALESSINLQEFHMKGTNAKEILVKSIDAMDSSMRKLIDVFKKKILTAAPDKSHLGVVKGITKKWETCKKKYQESIKSQDIECIRKLESSIDSITNALRNTYSNAMLKNSITGVDQITPIADSVRETLREFADFIRVKATRNFTIGSSTLSINKYLEEFPGLVHFMFIDRNTHRIVAPGLDFSCPETTSLTRKKIFKMIDLSRSYVEEGRTAVMWKDTVFSYSYFLWFEDISGTPIKPRISPASVVNSLPLPGILCGNFYQQLIDKCFPKKSPDKIRCFELYTIHLGLATSSCVLEHCRRLTATIWEVTGVPTNPLDLL